MDVDKRFENIKNNIKDGKYDLVLPEVRMIIGSDPKNNDLIIKCASLLKTVDQEDEFQSILDSLADNVPADDEGKIYIAWALRNLGRSEDAYDIIMSVPKAVAPAFKVASIMYDVQEYESALALIQESGVSDVKTRVLLTDVYCALGEFTKAEAVASDLLKEDGMSYDVLVNYCNVLFRKGDSKGAIRFSKNHLKDNKKDLDALATNAYVMKINGKIPAAVNYSTRVINADYKHIGALETLAYCLIEKKSFINAKLLAGAINDADPGNPAAIRILDACRLMSS